MEIEALKFVGGGSLEQPECITLHIGCDNDLLALNDKKAPAVYVVRDSALDELARFTGAVTDCGEKRKEVHLRKILQGHDRIPIVKGSYSSKGKLISGMRAFLRDRAFDQPACIVGVEEHIFNQFMENGKTGRFWRMESGGFVHEEPGDETLTGTLLNLLPEERVPSELEKRYIGASMQCQLVRKLIMRAAKTRSPVLIVGDTGTGKEIVADEISIRAGGEGRLTPVNCGAFPADLFESELFGHEKGSFTNATARKIGLWERAGKGTLFLDEIGDLSLGNQVKVLRALQDQKIRRVGGTEEITVEARVIAATHRDLHVMVQTDQFREDLYYRLRCFLIPTPALRDHAEDIPVLARHLWNEIRGGAPALSSEVLAALLTYPWPGNVRELGMVLKSLHSLFHDVGQLGPRHLRAVFDLHGITVCCENGRPAPGEARPSGHKAESIRHLHRVLDFIQATTRTISPHLADEGLDPDRLATVSAALQYRLDELDMLCLYPLRFGSEGTFNSVSALRTRLLYLRSLLKDDPAAGQAFWRARRTDDFEQVTMVIHRELETLTV